MMRCSNPRCMGNYNFDHIAYFAKKRFVEGYKTMDLLGSAKTEREKEEIALVCLLHLEDDKIQDLKLCCKYAGQCKAINCRDRLKKMIAKEMHTKPEKL